MKTVDVLIIGGGLSGLTLGYILKKEHKKVLIIEKDDLKKKDKLCGGLLTTKSYELLYSIFDKDKVEKLPFSKCNYVEIINQGKSNIIQDITTYTIYRRELDNFALREYLRIGGEIIDNINYDKIDFDNNEMYIGEDIIKYSYIVGADGIFSRVRQDVTRRKQKMNFALEIFSKDSNEKSISIKFFEKFKGYLWNIPNSKKCGIGIGEVTGKTSIKHLLSFDGKDKLRGAFLPRGNDILLRSNDNIFFVGDAAGLCSKLTGEGIYFALASSNILANSIIENKKYYSKMKQELYLLKRDQFYSLVVYNDKVRNFVFRRYGRNKFITSIVIKFAKKVL